MRFAYFVIMFAYEHPYDSLAMKVRFASNSGFVGWLTRKIKKELGTGVFVVCGQNSKNGGIFDYWGVPVAIAEEVITLVAALTE